MSKENFQDLKFAAFRPYYLAYRDAPETFRAHWHHLAEIVYSRQDGPVYEVNGQRITLHAGDILFIWPGELHEIVYQPQPSNTIMLIVDTHLLSDRADFDKYIYLLHNTRVLSVTPDQPYVDQLHRDMCDMRDLIIAKECFEETRMVILIYNFFMHLVTGLKLEEGKNMNEEHPHLLQIRHKVSETVNYLMKHCNEKITLEDAADMAGFSKCHFSKLFRKYTGQTYPEFMTAERLRYARTLLRNPELSITEISMESGFSSISTFNRVFLEANNVSPSEYRHMLSSQMK